MGFHTLGFLSVFLAFSVVADSEGYGEITKNDVNDEVALLQQHQIVKSERLAKDDRHGVNQSVPPVTNASANQRIPQFQQDQERRKEEKRLEAEAAEAERKKIGSNETAMPTKESESMTQTFLNEIEFELWSDRTGISTKNKVVLALIEGFALPAYFGVDRCYMGQTCVGIIKGITLGGLGIWALIDYIVVLINLLSKSGTISAFGYSASYTESSVHPAFVIGVVFLFFQILALCFSQRKTKPPPPPPA